MAKNSQPEPPEDYYRSIFTRPEKSVGRRKHYFEDTEPRQGRPTNGRVIDTERLHFLVTGMLGRLRTDVLLNAKFQWRHGTPLPSPGSPIQPLSSDMEKTNTL
jgi:hypothetical protein